MRERDFRARAAVITTPAATSLCLTFSHLSQFRLPACLPHICLCHTTSATKQACTSTMTYICYRDAAVRRAAAPAHARFYHRAAAASLAYCYLPPPSAGGSPAFANASVT
jgi:hypothetical protein